MKKGRLYVAPFFIFPPLIMKQLQLFYSLTITCLFISCGGQYETASTIDGENISISQIESFVGREYFNGLTPSKKISVVKKYSMFKQLSGLKQNDPGMDIDREKTRIENMIMIRKAEEHVFSGMEVSDSVITFISDAINTDMFVKALTVSHRFSFGKGHERTREEARQRAHNIYNRIFEGEINFEEAMSIYGELNVSKVKGNDMGQIYYGFMPKNFNDIIWTAGMGRLLEPVESPMGFHVIIVDHTLPKHGDKKVPFDRESIIRDLNRGRYGYQAEHFQTFMDDQYAERNIDIDLEKLYSAWEHVKTVEGVNTMYGATIDKLKILDPTISLGKNGDDDLTLGWIIDTAQQFTFFQTAAINNGHSFQKIITDIVSRYILVDWVQKNKNLFPNIQASINRQSMNIIIKKYFDKMEELHPDMTREIIINRFLIKNEISINRALFAEDISE